MYFNFRKKKEPYNKQKYMAHAPTKNKNECYRNIISEPRAPKPSRSKAKKDYT